MYIHAQVELRHRAAVAASTVMDTPLTVFHEDDERDGMEVGERADDPEESEDAEGAEIDAEFEADQDLLSEDDEDEDDE